jgi:hypothetical protein
MRVSLLGTVHGESGRANVMELHVILERLAPDVLFAEIPPAEGDKYIDGSHGNLESIAVARYRQNHHVAVIPVDLAKPEDEFFRNAEDMFRKVERTSPDYRRMFDRHSLDIRKEGFSYLNSDRCVRALTDIHMEVLATLDWIRVPQLHEVYAAWSRQNELRDTGMMRNIEDYAGSNRFVHGLFLVGAAHRKSLVDKARTRSGPNSPNIDWELDGRFGEHE